MSRAELLVSWLLNIFKETHYSIVALANDASFRRYWRVTTSFPVKSYVVMDAPPPETTQPFIDIAHLLAGQGLTVPSVLAADLQLGFLLLSDLGDCLYLNALKSSTHSVDELYRQALNALIKIQTCSPIGLSHPLPEVTTEFMQKQLDVFKHWYLDKHIGEHTGLSQSLLNIYEQKIQPVIDEVLTVILLQPHTLIHQDYHSRNLMVVEGEMPGILDFQGAMMGPITYDVVSLFQDCYIRFPLEQVLKWVLDYKNNLVENQLLSGAVSNDEFIKWFEWTGLQRHLKNLGSFARLHYRDGKSGYLSDIPRVLAYISQTCHRYKELTELWNFFEAQFQVNALVLEKTE